MQASRNSPAISTGRLGLTLLCLFGVVAAFSLQSTAAHDPGAAAAEPQQQPETDEKPPRKSRRSRRRSTQKMKPKTPVVAGEKWSVLHQPRRVQHPTRPLSAAAPMSALMDLRLDGPHQGHPFLFGQFRANGAWGMTDGVLHQITGRDSALLVATATGFELEGIIQADGTGGWYFLVGWDSEHGYLIYNVTMRKSGSPWYYAEFRGGKAIEESHQEFYRFTTKDPQPLRLTVAENKFSLKIGNELLADNIPLPNYHAGSVIMGTYDTHYGPKPLRIHSLRIRAL